MNASGKTYLEFEKPIEEIEKKIEEMVAHAESENLDMSTEITALRERAEDLEKEIYGNLTPWQKVLIARHPQRPYTMDYIDMMLTDFIELHGDRQYRDDPAIVGSWDGVIVATTSNGDFSSLNAGIASLLPGMFGKNFFITPCSIGDLYQALTAALFSNHANTVILPPGSMACVTSMHSGVAFNPATRSGKSAMVCFWPAFWSCAQADGLETPIPIPAMRATVAITAVLACMVEVRECRFRGFSLWVWRCSSNHYHCVEGPSSSRAS